LAFDISPVAIGRLDVRFINRSDFDSITILKALAPPAAKVPPSKDQIVIEIFGTPFEARNNAGTVVTKSSSTTLNFISERYFFIDPNSTLANLVNNY
jgi:hypothetical protein